MTDTDPQDETIQHIRKGNTVVAKQLRALADSVEKGLTRGLFVVHVDHHRRRDLIALAERYSIVELIGDIELEQLKLKMSVAMPEEDGAG